MGTAGGSTIRSASPVRYVRTYSCQSFCETTIMKDVNNKITETKDGLGVPIEYDRRAQKRLAE